MIRVPWSAVIREPILHFIVLAGLLFGAHAMLAERPRQTIQIDANTIEYLVRERALLTNRPITDAERRDVTETYVDEEVLLREAYRRGLNETPRIRAQLIQSMRQTLLGEAPRPSELELRAYFDANRARFERPPTTSLTQVFIAAGKPVPDDLMARLKAGGDPARAGGFDTRIGVAIRHASHAELAGLFGPEVARTIAAIDDREWHGPILAARGTYFIRIDARHPASMPSFEQVAAYVGDEWVVNRQRERLAAEIKRLSRDYDIEHLDADRSAGR
jgi:hypothetical protein